METQTEKEAACWEGYFRCRAKQYAGGEVATGLMAASPAPHYGDIANFQKLQFPIIERSQLMRGSV